MEGYLNYSKDFLLKVKGYHTAKEIEQQPKLWRETVNIIKNEKTKILKFLGGIYNEKTKIIFTGAGTSEFIGNILAPHLKDEFNLDVESIATTDIVNNPKYFILRNINIILISFARSGNSPESLATIDIVNNLVPDVKHITITCNKEGALAKYNIKNKLNVFMPEEANDSGFAMTSSFSSMLLAAYSIFHLKTIDKIIIEVNKLSNYIENNIKILTKNTKEIADKNHKRVVFLGAGAYKGLAQELSLKLLELCNGQIITMFDTPLGFRHGPKSIINKETLIFSFLSNDDYSIKYDLDLVAEIVNDNQANIIAFNSNKNLNNVENLKSTLFNFKYITENNIMQSLLFLLPCQIYSFMRSIACNITPDNPCPTGEVNRIVKGVIIYEYKRSSYL